jgi:hypothetical protein
MVWLAAATLAGADRDRGVIAWAQAEDSGRRAGWCGGAPDGASFGLIGALTLSSSGSGCK